MTGVSQNSIIFCFCVQDPEKVEVGRRKDRTGWRGHQMGYGNTQGMMWFYSDIRFKRQVRLRI